MKILIAYHSTTGNTEKVAKAIKEGITGHEVDLLNVKGIDPSSLGSYDLAFVGSGIFTHIDRAKCMESLLNNNYCSNCLKVCPQGSK